MTDADVIAIGREALLVVVIVGGPLMLIGLVVGLVISLFQALTQIQEQTITFVPKIVIMFAAMVFLMPFMLGHLRSFMEGIADKIVAIGSGG
ncbi:MULTISPECIES: flagellar biosynthesis protein FliQ [Rhodospirillales]|uniref:Flagellar biosynthetic protein FliQ n=2 Tax=Rhodospirillales TaxID=204441 RepID=B6IS87_RHOCS|nr:flagellar biosynthesis protein FliQ [Rhodospirillum centenum]ACI98323.1 flagellar biosynthesis protein FliQ [Rhodospirillum centenum SW]